MTKNINLDLKARGWQFALAFVFRDALPLTLLFFAFVPIFGLGFWMFNNLKTSVSRQNEFNHLVQECTSAQERIYGQSSSYSCKEAVNAHFRVYVNY